MPQLGETVTEGTITRWLKRVGETVEADEPLFEVSTDKVDSEVPAPASGVLVEIRVPEGDTVAVGTVLAVIGDAGSTPAAPTAAAPQPEPVPEAAPEPEPGGAVAPESVAPAPIVFSAGAAPAPSASAPPAPVPPAPVAPPPVSPPPDAGADARLTSPVVRRLLAEHGLDAADVTGTGPGGRVTRKDVLDAVEARGAGTPVAAPGAPVAAPTPAPSVAPAPAVAPPVVESAETAGTVVPMSVIRKRIAEHMVRSQAASAHAYVSVEVDFERVAIVRAAHRDAWRACEGFSLTYLPFIARAVSDCIDDYPVVNASIDGESLVLHPALHLAIAVDLAFEGLIAPVIRDADGKRLRQIAREVNDLATRARAKQLNPDEVQGGTFTITNPGPYGTYQTLAIINQPQVAILATDGITKQARVVEGVDGADVIAIRHTGLLTLGWDHRAFDGAYAAAFLNAMRDVLEHRDWETELE
jgi:2-oxoglutarate dehydrogenase E2 component (dihydrolipoamide succinyltransferase)